MTIADIWMRRIASLSAAAVVTAMTMVLIQSHEVGLLEFVVFYGALMSCQLDDIYQSICEARKK